jgi:hypothetical protein
MATSRQAHKCLMAGEASANPIQLVVAVFLMLAWKTAGGPWIGGYCRLWEHAGGRALPTMLRKKGSDRGQSPRGEPGPLASSNRD